MRITLLPSAMPHVNGPPRQYLTSFLVNDTIAIDAGSLGFWGDTLDEQSRVRNIFLTHAHLDHLASLPIFLENVYQANGDPVTIHASAAVIDVLEHDLFTGRLWPDFLHLPGPPFCRLNRLEAGVPIEVDGTKFTPIEVSHLVPTFGFLIEQAGRTVAISSDTGPTEELWKHANAEADLRGVFLEASFPNHLERLAQVSGHLTPAQFATEARKLQRRVPLIAVHIKSRFFDQVAQELRNTGLKDVEIGRFNAAYDF